MSSGLNPSASSTYASSLPTGTISALIGHPPNTTEDYSVAKSLLLAFRATTDPALGAFIPPARPANYVFENRGPRILASMSVSIAVMFLVTSLRLGVRTLKSRLILGWDDFFIVPGVLLAIAWSTLRICCVVYGGAGKHMFDVTYEEYAAFKKYTCISEIVFFISIGTIKVSICLFNRRLVSLTSQAWMIFNNVFLFLLSIYIILALFWNVFQCDPPYANWDIARIGREGRVPKCQTDNLVGTSLSIVHVIMDFGLLSVPLAVLWKVRMGWRARLRIYLVFSVGSMSMIGSILRQISLARLKSDFFWNFISLEDWALVDLTIGVVAASLPTLSALLPKSWISVSDLDDTPGISVHVNNSNNSRSGYIQSLRMTSISWKPERVDSEENIFGMDVIELANTNEAELWREEKGTSTSSLKKSTDETDEAE